MYMANSGRMTRDWFFVIDEDPETGEGKFQTGEASCLADARKCVFSPGVLFRDRTFVIVRLRAGKWFENPAEYSSPGFGGEVIERRFVPGA